MKRKILIYILAFCAAATIQAAKASPIPMIDGNYKALMQKAAREGKASAYLSGQVADYIREQIKKPDAKILLEITRVDDHGKPGCHGLRMKFTTPRTLLPMIDGTSKELDMGYFMNMCPK
ncbi:MAG: hypothetical protein LBU76_05365 [Azoarcus sp.]|jgi:hypothetical protein|nr:hypothetical protein [Azoarcus sp.]